MRPLAIALTLFSLAACTPPPLPPAQTAKGKTDATIALPAQGAALKARLQGSSKATVEEGGWVELRIFANEKQCTWDQVVRQGGMGPNFGVMLNCEVDVPSGKPFTFRAEQVMKDAQTSEVALEVAYSR
jgi:hypothetical protein